MGRQTFAPTEEVRTMSKSKPTYHGIPFVRWASDPGVTALGIRALMRSPAHYRLAAERFSPMEALHQNQGVMAIELLKQMLANDVEDATELAGLILNSAQVAYRDKDRLLGWKKAIEAHPSWRILSKDDPEWNVSKVWSAPPGLKSRIDVWFPKKKACVRLVLLPDLGAVKDNLNLETWRLFDAVDWIVQRETDGVPELFLWLAIEAGADVWTKEGAAHAVQFIETTPAKEDLERIPKLLEELRKCQDTDTWPATTNTLRLTRG